MSPKRASEITKGIIIDVDNALAGITRPIEDRHSAGVSAAILAVRLLGGACVNLARIASSLERMSEAKSVERQDGAEDRRLVADEGAAGPQADEDS